jgi:photosystem II stability/assembly factor-like uncharacterized protein
MPGPETNFFGIAFYPGNPDALTAVGGDGAIVETTNGGVSWLERTSYTENVFRGVAIATPRCIAAGAGDVIRRSTNSGATWLSVSNGYVLRDVAAVPGTQSAWAVGDFSTIFFSSDAGVSWIVEPAPIAGDFSAVAFPDSMDGFLTMTGLGRVYRTTDGGAIWTNTSSTGIVNVTDIAFADPDTGHIVGTNAFGGLISYSTDMGVAWTAQISSRIPNLNGIAYCRDNIQTKMAVGDSGCIMHLVDSGSSWEARNSGTIYDLNGVAYASQSHIYAVGDLETITRSTDGGSTWAIQTSGSGPSTLYDVLFTSQDSGFAVGTNGLILAKDSEVGISGENSLAPVTYILSQNYPNPFNAQTVIQYSLPMQSKVSIDIFDLRGRRIETISEGPRDAGIHRVTWNAEGRSSGIYFYRIEADGIIGSKKMVLIK